MDQLTQKLKDGKVNVIETPLPAVGPGMILVQNHYSLISTGTEGSTTKAARKSLIGKARERPQQVKQVLDVLRTQGPTQTYRAVMKKLDAHSPLGYSCAGRVIGLAPDVTAFQVGDLVACGGLSASHAEVVAVPVNLAVKLAEDADLKQAAYNTLGSIAMQGVRQADLRLGETAVVIGLGLLGQLTCLLLRASGVRTVGIDIRADMVELAGRHSADLALERGASGLTDAVDRFTAGLGCDAVIITAAASSLDPVNLAGRLARKKGLVVVVGAVPTGFDRENYYKKELDLRMSCSYGPGRYDPVYEEKGLDYPAGYVRWTENRNMQAFQDLLASGRIDFSFLTTHTFPLTQAPEAYDMIVGGGQSSVGILIEYDAAKVHDPSAAAVRLKTASGGGAAAVGIGFIGAGSYAQSHLLPNISPGGDTVLKGVMTATSAGSRSSGDRFGFEFCTTRVEDILDNPDINTVFVATRHDTHAQYVQAALKAGKNVFVEKPLCLRPEELEEIAALYLSLQNSGGGRAPILMVGYNRRFSPHIVQIKKNLTYGPPAVLYRINAGAIPADTWIQDPEVGGGRIIGEVCHFVDLAAHLAGSQPESVYASALSDPAGLNDTLNVVLRYPNGATAAVSYLANGDKSLPKERIEVYSGGSVWIVDDFLTITTHRGGRKKAKKLMGQDKGQKAEVAAFLDAVRRGSGEVIPFEDIYGASCATFRIIESIRTDQRLTPNDCRPE